MKKASGIGLVLVLVLCLASVQAFAEKAELSLKYWYAGVGGADVWVADCEEYDSSDWEDDPELGDWFEVGVGLLSVEKLMLHFAPGTSFILSGSYSLSPSVSLGVSYWGLSRNDKVIKALDYPGYFEEDIPWSDGDVEGRDQWGETYYRITFPWLYYTEGVWGEYGEWSYSGVGHEEYGEYLNEGLIRGNGDLLMSALDVSGRKSFSGPGWEVGFSGGIRKATFSQSQLTLYEYIGEEEWYQLNEDEVDSEFWGFRAIIYTESILGVSAIGPQVSIEGTCALGDKLSLEAGAKAGFLFGTAETKASLGFEEWDYDSDVSDEWNLYIEFEEEYPLTKEPIRVSTYDLSFGLAYQIAEQWSIEAGYYASIWNGIPSLVQAVGDEPDNGNGYASISNGGPSIPIRWEEDGARTITVGGLTIGLNFKF
ncbi:MAG: hypothetical protein WAQ94_06395 [Bacillota bacterium]